MPLEQYIFLVEYCALHCIPMDYTLNGIS